VSVVGLATPIIHVQTTGTGAVGIVGLLAVLLPGTVPIPFEAITRSTTVVALGRTVTSLAMSRTLTAVAEAQ
jgi:hypothetical protein